MVAGLLSSAQREGDDMDTATRFLHRDPDTYRYIPASIRHYPGAQAVARMLEERGFVSAKYHRVLAGLMAIHDAVRG